MPRIALVDDEDSILISVSLALEQEGFEVDTCIEEKKIVLGYFGTKIPPTKDDNIVGIDDIEATLFFA